MHLHHFWIGLIVVLWSIVAIPFLWIENMITILLFLGGGVFLMVDDCIYHLTHRGVLHFLSKYSIVYLLLKAFLITLLIFFIIILFERVFMIINVLHFLSIVPFPFNDYILFAIFFGAISLLLWSWHKVFGSKIETIVVME